MTETDDRAQAMLIVWRKGDLFFHDSVSCGAAAVCIACGISLSWVLKRHQVRTVSVPFWNSKGYYQTELSRKVMEKIQCSCQEISLSQTKL